MTTLVHLSTSLIFSCFYLLEQQHNYILLSLINGRYCTVKMKKASDLWQTDRRLYLWRVAPSVTKVTAINGSPHGLMTRCYILHPIESLTFFTKLSKGLREEFSKWTSTNLLSLSNLRIPIQEIVYLVNWQEEFTGWEFLNYWYKVTSFTLSF